MAQATLHIFAVNAEIDVRHTFLSRSKGDAPMLPDLAGWLSLRQGGLDTDNIELFPVGDLGDLKLADYVATAFDTLEEPLKKAAPKLNALDGHVLLIPGAALAGDWQSGSNLTLIDTLPLSVADHTAEALETEASSYGRPAQDHIGWHSKKKGSLKSRQAIALVLITFLIVMISLSVLVAA